MKILMSALACEPGKGSELEVGFRALLAAASRHEVWVLTNTATIPVVRTAIQEYPWADRVHFEGIYFEVDDELYPRLTAPGFHRYYDRWQRKAAVRAAKLDRLVDFDVVHHVTLAAHWTRAGVVSVDKPLVWGPVGGGVEVPISLLRELGWRGLGEEAGRFVARRVLATLGPARRAQRRAIVTFAQNRDTARLLSTSRNLHVLPNATSVDVREGGATEPRRTDILFVARLLPWKGARLAIRALRHLKHPDAVLRVFGDGPDRRRIARAARRWGVADRVRFEGYVRREHLLRLVATAGVFLHPAFHDEAGLAVAEALSLGTPVVCLDRGGPAELLRHWPDSPAVAVPPRFPEDTARDIAAAIDRFLLEPPPVVASPRRAATSFDEALLDAYDTAFTFGRGFPHPREVWGFPAGKLQVFAENPRALSRGVLVYGFGRRMPRLVQRAIAWQVRIPGLRRFVAERCARVEPVCGWDTWNVIAEKLRERNSSTGAGWLQFSSQWEKQRSNLVALDARGKPQFFVTVEPMDNPWRGSLLAMPSFRVPACTDSFRVGEWSIRQYEPLPQFHRPAAWNPERIRQVAADVSRALGSALERPADIPSHWLPMHGDLVPWNLREDDGGQLWLLDWEDASWGPPMADLVRFLVAYHSLGWRNPTQIAALVHATFNFGPEEDLLEIAKFWVGHHNLRPVQNNREWPRTKARDAARAARELATFAVLAAGK